MDMMDGSWGDHNVFSKYLLGWITPVIRGTNPSVAEISLRPSGTNPNSILIMPGAALNSYGEFFMTQYREPGNGNTPMTMDSFTSTCPPWGPEVNFTKKGLWIWHADATLNANQNFLYNNQNGDHKLLRLLEALMVKNKSIQYSGEVVL